MYKKKNNTIEDVWNYILGFIRWARCDLYYIFTVTDRFRRKKNNNNTGVGGNESHFSGSGTGRDFPPVFSWDWVGKRLIFVGVGRERFENSLPCHPLPQTNDHKYELF